MHAKENNFEREVQQKLQDLDFTPSSSVWENIEARLPEEKKRRGAFFLWGALLVAAAFSGYLFFNPKLITNKNISTTSPSAIAGQKHTDNVFPTLPKDPVVASLQKTVTNHQPITTDGNNNETDKYRSKNSVKELAGSNNIQPPRAAIGKLTVIDTDASVTSGKSIPGGTLSGLIIDEKENRIAPAIVSKTKNFNNTFNVKASVKQLAIVTEAATSVKRPMNKKWGFEFSLSAGQSIFNSGLLNKLFTATEPTIVNNSASLPPGTSLARAQLKPSEVKPGIGLMAGLDLRHKLSKRLFVTAGLHYSLITTSMYTGDRRKGIMVIYQDGQPKEIDEYYYEGTTNSYTNKYHFAELPVLLHLQLNEGKKLPLFINGGLSVAQLLTTNALHYDGTSYIYYEDKNLFNKTFLNLQGGFSAHLFAHKKVSLIAGPQIKYGLTNLINVNLPDGTKHALFIGIKAAVPVNF